MARAARLALTAACITGLLGGCTAGAVGPSDPTPTGSATTTGRPNIVFILTDDLSYDLVPYMDNVAGLASDGFTFNDYFVSNSLCCPSRATILTGKYPHNSGVLSNTWPAGGFDQFYLNDLNDSAGPLMQAAGYRTGFMGKFMNEYLPAGVSVAKEHRPTYPAAFVPPGWNEWDAIGSGGYQEFDYNRAVAIDESGGTVETTEDSAEDDYVTDVLSRDAGDFITRATDSPTETPSPFFLIVSTYGPHSAGSSNDPEDPSIVFPAAPRDRPVATKGQTWPSQWAQPEFTGGDCGNPIGGGCSAVVFPPTDSRAMFGKAPENAPSWMSPQRYSASDVASLREWYLERIQVAQSLDDLVGQVRDDLENAGVLDNTYLVFSSDNGFHLGQHDLWFGKRTAFDHDINVPLIVRPPGGRVASSVDAIAQNTDLLPTFLDIAGTPTAAAGQDGRSLLPFMTGADPADWRTGAFVEQKAEDGHAGDDPDAEDQSTRPPDYRAIRTATYLYVDYAAPGTPPTARREGEFYDLRTDPDEMNNIYDRLRQSDKVALARAVATYATCAGPTCRQIDQLLPLVDVKAGRS